MDNISVLILEDNPVESAALAMVLEANGFTVAGITTSSAGALALLFNQKTDLVIIDIFLDGNPEGISFAEAINAIPNMAIPFVFLTNSANRTIFERAKLTRPFSFLMKPFNELEIIYAIEMAVEKFYAQPNVFHSKEQDTVVSSEYLFIRKKDSLKKVAVENIVYIEVEERYCNIITEAEKFTILISLTKITGLLDARQFIRTHRNYIVNAEKITEVIVADNLVLLKGNHQVALSEKYREFINRFIVLR
jgi:two-component system, LytTR family, response regulator